MVTRLRNVRTGWAAFRAFRQIPTPSFASPVGIGSMVSIRGTASKARGW